MPGFHGGKLRRGNNKPWEHEELAEIFYNEWYNMCQILSLYSGVCPWNEELQ